MDYKLKAFTNFKIQQLLNYLIQKRNIYVYVCSTDKQLGNLESQNHFDTRPLVIAERPISSFE